MSGDLLLPPALAARAARGPGWATWLDGLPRLLSDLLAQWELVPAGASRHGRTAVMVPVNSASVGAEVGDSVLKVAYPDEETEHEALALQRWGGRGAVRLLRADPHRRALLLEALPGPDLSDLWDVEACQVVAGLYATLHLRAPAQLQTLAAYLAPSDAALGGLPRDAPVPRRLVEQARALTRDLLADPASVGTLVHTDLHYENVLAALRAPCAGHRPEAAQRRSALRAGTDAVEQVEEMVASGDVRDAVRRRFHTLVDTADLDEHRARDWVVVRMVHGALWELQARPEAPDREWLTRCVAIAKAVQD